jgi:hypothetical protein
MSDDTDFRDLLADIPPDSAPEPPVRQGRRVKPLAAHDRDANNCFFCETSNPKRPPNGNGTMPSCAREVKRMNVTKPSGKVRCA